MAGVPRVQVEHRDIAGRLQQRRVQQLLDGSGTPAVEVDGLGGRPGLGQHVGEGADDVGDQVARLLDDVALGPVPPAPLERGGLMGQEVGQLLAAGELQGRVGLAHALHGVDQGCAVAGVEGG